MTFAWVRPLRRIVMKRRWLGTDRLADLGQDHVAGRRQAQPASTPYRQNMSSKLPTIVVIDDSAEVRSLVKTRLGLSGKLDVVGDGNNGMEAIGLALHHQPSLLLLDLSMPAMDGLDALPGILQVSPATRVVVFTGFEERGIADTARELGATGFIEKSLPIEQLADALLAFLPGSPAPAPPSPAHRRLSIVGDRTARGKKKRVGEDQRVLDEHLESFREVFDKAAIGMATMTLTGTIVRANDALADLMLTEAGVLVGLDYGQFMSGRGDLLDAALDEISHHMTDLAEIEHDVSGVKDPLRVRGSLAAVRDSKGEALYVFLQLQDITAQTAAEERWRRSEERFRLLVEAVQEYAIFMLDTGGFVASWNSGAQRIKGYTAEEIIGQHFRKFYPPAQQANRHPEHELAAALRDGRYEEEGWRVRKDGTQFWANVLITAVFNEVGDHIGFAKVTRDTTQQRHAEEERERSTAALAEANADLETLAEQLGQAVHDQSQFLAIIAHELRTPLTVLGGSAETLARHWSELAVDDRTGLLNGMTASSRRLQRLLADLLAASRLDAKSLALDLADVSLSAVIGVVMNAIRALDPSAAVSVQIDDDLIVRADRDRLAQAVENLVRNALSHGAPPVRVSAAEVDGMATIRVVDSGEGVDPEFLPRLFDRFATGDLDGTGLGLFIARELARAHGGNATYEPPTEDQAAGAFRLTVPLAPPST